MGTLQEFFSLSYEVDLSKFENAKDWDVKSKHFSNATILLTCLL